MRSFYAGDTIRIALEFESEAEVGRGIAIFYHENDPYWSLTFIGDAEPIAGEARYRMQLSAYITDNLPAGEYQFSYMRGERYGSPHDGLELAFDRVPDIRVVVTGAAWRRSLRLHREYWAGTGSSGPSPPTSRSPLEGL
jgi:hypothetical protein